MQQKILNNRYELEQRIGEGGMARVYRGRDLRLNRRVAIKVLHSHYASDPNFLERFHHEAQAAANLRHPNIVDVYDVGQDGDIQYIVMEYVEGHDLKALILKNGALPIEQAVAIAQAVAEALDAAHRAGLIHRDVKPQNIIVSPSGRVKITDFGIAKSKLSTATTETGIAFGTADYISPEQARGQPATLSSDIYMLGVTLYEMLTGRLPFSGDNSIAVAMQHANTDPPPPRMYNPRIPLHLEALVLRALSKDPEERPASAREFAQQLRRYRTAGEQETVIQPAAPRPVAPRPAARPAPQPFAPATRDLPPLRSATTLPPPSVDRNTGFGGFLLGLLLLAGMLGIVYLFAVGTFSELFNFATAAGSRQPPAIVGSAEPATLEPTATAAATATAEPTALPTVEVPNLGGLDAEQAAATLYERHLSPLEDATAARYSDTVPQGQVLDQLPRAGTVVTETSIVTYALSLGPESVEIPDVTGYRPEVGRQRLEQAGFKTVIREEPSDQFDPGFIIRTEPRPPARPRRGETITIFVSIGNVTIMPDVTGLPEEEARRRISEAGLVWSYSDSQKCGEKLSAEICSRYGPGIVVSSEPRGGSRVQRGTSVTLGVRAP